MHPTADTLLVSYLQSLGAAGDAGRYAFAPCFGNVAGRLRAVEGSAT
jgi:hypothetical protein